MRYPQFAHYTIPLILELPDVEDSNYPRLVLQRQFAQILKAREDIDRLASLVSKFPSDTTDPFIQQHREITTQTIDTLRIQLVGAEDKLTNLTAELYFSLANR
jgi:hypothetical protein